MRPAFLHANASPLPFHVAAVGSAGGLSVSDRISHCKAMLYFLHSAEVTSHPECYPNLATLVVLHLALTGLLFITKQTYHEMLITLFPHL